MYKERIYVNEERFAVRPSVVHSDKETEIRITSLDPSFDFHEGTVFELRIVPKDFSEVFTDAEYSLFGKEKTCSVQEVFVKNGQIAFKYLFYGSQEWILYLKKKNDNDTEWYWTDSFSDTRARLSIYSLTDDLYGCIPMKGDLHIHTNLSDGGQSPEFVAAAYREAGFDFIAITDHYKYNDGKSLSEKFSFADPLQFLPGEEIHDSSSVIHMISVGGSRSISALLEEPDLEARVYEMRKKYTVPEGLYEWQYLLRAYIYEQIKKDGGYGILPHPLWQIPERYSVEVPMSRAILENRLTDAFEVFGGCTPEGNDLQLSFYHSLKGDPLPVVGSSDAHTVYPANTAFNEIFTIAFVKDTIINSIIERKSVAVYYPKGEKPRTCGDFECSKYAQFLLRIYFPKHNALCKKSGELLKKYVEGDLEIKEEIVSAEEEVRAFRKGFFGL